jgi:hypothetical protein
MGILVMRLDTLANGVLLHFGHISGLCTFSHGSSDIRDREGSSKVEE